MHDDNQISGGPKSEPDLNLDSIDQFGGEALEGPGFEQETPEPASEWRDPR